MNCSLLVAVGKAQLKDIHFGESLIVTPDRDKPLEVSWTKEGTLATGMSVQVFPLKSPFRRGMFGIANVELAFI